jgi:pilus assembly protein Flp/PilA
VADRDGVNDVRIFKRLSREDAGATAIEYGLIAALIAVAAITAMGSLGNAVKNTYTTVGNKMNTANTTASA